jgi:hypothetical protein
MAKKTAKSKKVKGKASRAIARKSEKARVTTRKKRKTNRPVRGQEGPGKLLAYEPEGLGARSAGQAGDTQGLSASPGVDSESVEELMEEGQPFEAEVLNGIETATDPDEDEVKTHEVPEDDVPDEYREKE